MTSSRCTSTLYLDPVAETVRCTDETGHDGLHRGRSADGVARRWLDGVTPGSEGRR